MSTQHLPEKKPYVSRETLGRFVFGKNILDFIVTVSREAPSHPQRGSFRSCSRGQDLILWALHE